MTLVDVATLAVHLGISQAEVYRLVRAGKLHPVGPRGMRARATGGMRFDLDSIEEDVQVQHAET